MREEVGGLREELQGRKGFKEDTGDMAQYFQEIHDKINVLNISVDGHPQAKKGTSPSESRERRGRDGKGYKELLNNMAR